MNQTGNDNRATPRSTVESTAMPPARSRRPSVAVPRPVRPAVALGLLWLLYGLGRAATDNQWSQALLNARRIVDLQRRLGLPSEASLQSLFLDDVPLLQLANTYYLAAHFPGMIAFLAWAWLRARGSFDRAVPALVTATMAALAVHVTYPLAPPRLLDSFVDTGAVYGPNPYQLPFSDSANQIAAMPSMHVGWALLVALGVAAASRSGWRHLLFLHPLATTFTVLVTANHYWLDVLAGALIALVALWIWGALSRLTDARHDRVPSSVGLGAAPPSDLRS